MEFSHLGWVLEVRSLKIIDQAKATAKAQGDGVDHRGCGQDKARKVHKGGSDQHTVDKYIEFMPDMDYAMTKLECFTNYSDRNKAESAIDKQNDSREGILTG